MTVSSFGEMALVINKEENSSIVGQTDQVLKSRIAIYLSALRRFGWIRLS